MEDSPSQSCVKIHKLTIIPYKGIILKRIFRLSTLIKMQLFLTANTKIFFIYFFPFMQCLADVVHVTINL
jgi:hypothetical protein